MQRPHPSLVTLLGSLVLAALTVIACGASPAAQDVFNGDAGAEPPPEEEAEDSGPQADAKPKGNGPDEAAAPEVTSVSPSSATVGSVGPTVIVTGKSFVPRSVVQLDGAPLATSFVSESELRATIPSSKMTTVGSLRVSVGTAPPGGGASKDLTFSVVNPTPAVTALDPLSVLAGSVATALDLTGTGFVNGAKVVFGTTDLATTLVDDTHLSATIPAASLVTSATVPVKVVNPAPGGGASTPISFTVSNPSASISTISPSSAAVGASTQALTVSGAGFIPTSIVLFNGTQLTTTFSSPSKLTAQVPASLLTTAGDFPVSVQNAPPGGGVSAPVAFKVQYPIPTASSVSPSSATAGAPPTLITVTGAGFNSMSQITFDGAPQATTYVDASHLKMTVSASDLTNAGPHQVRVMNPPPGGGTSSALAFNVNNGPPTLTSVSPSSIVAGSPDTVVTLTGTNYVSGSLVKSNGVVLATTYVSPTSLTATVSSAQLAYTGTLAISVANPAPGGGTSGSKSVSLTPPATCPESGAGGGMFGGHCYFLSPTARTQPLASNACASASAHLVTITSSEEWYFVRNIGAGGTDRWIGLTQPGTSTIKSNFTWVTGETPGPDPSWWDAGEPNGSESAVLNVNNKIADRYGTNNYFAICERE
jgi:hypothetical protein